MGDSTKHFQSSCAVDLIRRGVLIIDLRSVPFHIYERWRVENSNHFAVCHKNIASAPASVMPFQPPSWVPALNVEEEIPESLSIADFFLDERYGRLPYEQSRPPFIDSQSGKAPSIQTVNSQVDYLARGLVKDLGWQTSSGTQWDKVVGVFSENTVGNIIVVANHLLLTLTADDLFT